jgi:hypothetical protein
MAHISGLTKTSTINHAHDAATSRFSPLDGRDICPRTHISRVGTAIRNNVLQCRRSLHYLLRFSIPSRLVSASSRRCTCTHGNETANREVDPVSNTHNITIIRNHFKIEYSYSRNKLWTLKYN